MGSYTGYIKSKVDFKTPISGALVKLYTKDTVTLVDTTTSDKNGKYAFTGIPLGTYQVRLFGMNYDETDWFDIVVIDGIVSGENAIQYYIRPLTGTAFKTDIDGSTTPSFLAIEARKVDGNDDQVLEDPSIALVTPGLSIGQFSHVFIPSEITGSRTIFLSGNNTVYDTITLADITDGTPAITGYVSVAPSLAYFKSNTGVWDRTNETEIQGLFYRNGVNVKQGTVYLELDDTVAGTLHESSSPDLDPGVSYSWVGEFTSAMTAIFSYEDATASETVYAFKNGTNGINGINGSGAATVQYYLRSINGTAFKTDTNGITTPDTLTIQARVISGGLDSILTDNNMVFVTSGLSLGTVHEYSFMPNQITGARTIMLSGYGQVRDSITLIDVTDGLDSTIGSITVTSGLAWARNSLGAWNRTGYSTADIDFYKSGALTKHGSLRVNLNTVSGTLSYSNVNLASGITATYTGNNTSTLGIGFSYDGFSVNESFYAIQDGTPGASGISGTNGTNGATGAVGPGLVYRGLYNDVVASGTASYRTFYSTSARRDVVYYNSGATPFWYCSTGYTPAQYATFDASKWTAFDTSFTAVATELLLAKDATITRTLVMGDVSDGGLIRSYNASAFRDSLSEDSAGFWIQGDNPFIKFRVGTAFEDTLTAGITFDGQTNEFELKAVNTEISAAGSLWSKAGGFAGSAVSPEIVLDSTGFKLGTSSSIIKTSTHLDSNNNLTNTLGNFVTISGWTGITQANSAGYIILSGGTGNTSSFTTDTITSYDLGGGSYTTTVSGLYNVLSLVTLSGNLEYRTRNINIIGSDISAASKTRTYELTFQASSGDGNIYVYETNSGGTILSTLYSSYVSGFPIYYTYIFNTTSTADYVKIGFKTSYSAGSIGVPPWSSSTPPASGSMKIADIKIKAWTGFSELSKDGLIIFGNNANYIKLTKGNFVIKGAQAELDTLVVNNLVIRGAYTATSSTHTHLISEIVDSGGRMSGWDTVSTWYSGATPLSIAKGGTALTTLGSANTLLGVNSGGTLLEYKTPGNLLGSANQLTVTGGTGVLGTTGNVTLSLSSSITISGLTMPNLIASRLMATDSGKIVSSVTNLTAWISGVTNQINIANDGDGSVTLSTPQNIHSAASPTFNNLTLSGLTASRLVASDSSKILSSVSTLTSWIAGTTNQISVANDGDGSITLSTPQNIDTAANVQFGSISISGIYDITSYGAANADVTALIAGSAFGAYISNKSAAMGHIAIGLRSNDDNDSFSIISNSTGNNTPVDKLVFQVKRTGVTLINGATTISGNTAISGYLTLGTQATTTAMAVRADRAITIAGTTNQITSSAGAQNLISDRTWTLSTPQNIDTAANVTFGVVNAISTSAGAEIAPLIVRNNSSTDGTATAINLVTSASGTVTGKILNTRVSSSNYRTDIFNYYNSNLEAISMYQAKVGINTAVPNEALEVYSNAASTTGIRIRTAASQSSKLDFYRTDSIVASRILVDASSNMSFYVNNDTTNYAFQVYNDKSVNFSNIITYSGGFTSGFTGSGWRIDQGTSIAGESAAEFDNLTIRGTMRVYELLIQQIRATNGSLIVSSAAKVDSSTGSAGAESITFEDPSNHNLCPFAVGDIIICQRVKISGTSGNSGDIVKRIVRKVASVSGKTITVSYATAGPTDTNVIEKGDDFVRVGSETNSSRRGLLYLTADDSNSPYLEIDDDVSSWTSWKTYNKLKARLGKLTGVNSPTLGNLQGYGLYSRNVYLEENANIVGNLTVGGGVGNTSTFYAGKITTNYFQNSDLVYGLTVLTSGGISPVTYNLYNNRHTLVASNTSYMPTVISGQNYTVSAYVQVYSGVATNAYAGIGFELDSSTSYKRPDNTTGDYSAYYVPATPTTQFHLESGYNRLVSTVSWNATYSGKAPSVYLYVGSTTPVRVYITNIQFEKSDYVTVYQRTGDSSLYGTGYGMWAIAGGFGGYIQDPVVRLNDYGMFVRDNGGVLTGNHGVSIGASVATWSSGIPATYNTTSASNFGIFGYSSGTELFALRGDGTAQIAGWSLEPTLFSKYTTTPTETYFSINTDHRGSTRPAIYIGWSDEFDSYAEENNFITLGGGTVLKNSLSLAGATITAGEHTEANGLNITVNTKTVLFAGKINDNTATAVYAAYIAGWSFDENKLYKNNIQLNSANEEIVIGAGASSSSNTGIYFKSDGTFNIASSAANYIRKSGNLLDIKSTQFNLVASGVSSIGLGATSYSAGNGVWVSNTSAQKFRVGNASASRMQFDDSNLEIYNSSNQKLVSLGSVNTIASWNLTSNTIQNTSGQIIIGISGLNNYAASGILTLGGTNASGTNKALTVYGANASQKVRVFYSGSSWGIDGTNTLGNTVFQLGSTNNIAGWGFTTSGLSNGSVSLLSQGNTGTNVNGLVVSLSGNSLIRVGDFDYVTPTPIYDDITSSTVNPLVTSGGFNPNTAVYISGMYNLTQKDVNAGIEAVTIASGVYNVPAAGTYMVSHQSEFPGYCSTKVVTDFSSLSNLKGTKIRFDFCAAFSTEYSGDDDIGAIAMYLYFDGNTASTQTLSVYQRTQASVGIYEQIDKRGANGVELLLPSDFTSCKLVIQTTQGINSVPPTIAIGNIKIYTTLRNTIQANTTGFELYKNEYNYFRMFQSGLEINTSKLTINGFNAPRFRGRLADDPEVNLVGGDIYVNTTGDKVKIYDGVSWRQLN